MKTYYIAAIVPESEKDGGGFSVYLPDVPGAVTCGDSIEESIEMAEDVLRIMLQDLAAENKEIPEPSSQEEIRQKVEAQRKEVDLEYPEETVYQYIQAPSLNMVPVKLSISMPKAVLEEIDAKAKSYGFTRSAFLAHAAQIYTPERVREDMEMSFEHMLGQMQKILEKPTQMHK